MNWTHRSALRKFDSTCMCDDDRNICRRLEPCLPALYNTRLQHGVLCKADQPLMVMVKKPVPAMLLHVMNEVLVANAWLYFYLDCTVLRRLVVA